MISLLNIGAGKISHDDFSDYNFVVHLDGSYTDVDEHSIENAMAYIRDLDPADRVVRFVKSDIYDFIYSWPYKFNHINADRIFEHQFYDAGQVGQLLDACNQITTDNGMMTIVVPNHKMLAELLLSYERDEVPKYIDNKGETVELGLNSDAIKMMLNTEFCNTRVDPHGSIWTPRTAREMIEAEGNTWKILNLQECYPLKGRVCYMKIELAKEV